MPTAAGLSRVVLKPWMLWRKMNLFIYIFGEVESKRLQNFTGCYSGGPIPGSSVLCSVLLCSPVPSIFQTT